MWAIERKTNLPLSLYHHHLLIVTSNKPRTATVPCSSLALLFTGFVSVAMAQGRTTVCNPVKKSGPMGQNFVTYTVQSSFDLNSDCVNSPEFTVERRYNDFVLLQKELTKAYPGAIIPPLPKDQMFGRFKQEFIESRMRALDEFITRIHNHPQLSESPYLRSFLSLSQFDEATIAATEDPSGGNKRSSWRDDMWKLNPTLKESQDVDTSVMDAKMGDIIAYVESIKEATEAVANATDKLLKAEKEVSRELCAGSEQYASLGVIDDNKLGTAIRQLGQSMNTVGSYMEEDVSEKEISVKEPFQAYLKAIKSIEKAHGTQREKRSKYLCLVTDLDHKEKAHDKEPGEAKFAKVVQCRNEVDMAKREYEEVSERLLSDFARMKSERRRDMVRMMVAFLTVEKNFTSKAGSCLDELDANMATLESWNVEAAFATSDSSASGSQQQGFF